MFVSCKLKLKKRCTKMVVFKLVITPSSYDLANAIEWLGKISLKQIYEDLLMAYLDHRSHISPCFILCFVNAYLQKQLFIIC